MTVELIYSIETNEDYWTRDSSVTDAEFEILLDTVEQKIGEYLDQNYPGMEYEFQRVPETMSHNNRSRTYSDRAEAALEDVQFWMETRWPVWWEEAVNAAE